jgi:hypothetical protein
LDILTTGNLSVVSNGQINKGHSENRKGLDEMNELQQGKQIEQDAARIKKDLNAMLANRVSQITEEIEKLTGEAKESVMDAAVSVKKDVGHRLSQYNAKAEEVAKKVPVDLSTRQPGIPGWQCHLPLSSVLYWGVCSNLPTSITNNFAQG